jgi:acetate kinase
VDALVFTAGIGEMGPHIRQLATECLADMGIVIDEKKNALAKCRNAELDITGPGSKVKVFVIPTDEELVMTEDAFALMKGSYDVHTNYHYYFENRDYVNKTRAAGLEKDLAKKPWLKDIIARIP